MAFDPDDLHASFGHADEAHFAWQTTNPFISKAERTLVQGAFLPLAKRVLDVGCGQGATFFHLHAGEGAVGIDIFEEKIRFAREHLPKCSFRVASAFELPFEAGSFDQVIFRDVLHHLAEPERAIREARRVLAPGGRIDLLEPCRYSPLILAHAITHTVERGVLRSTVRYLEGLLAADFDVERVEKLQPFSIHRVVFHPVMGSPALAERALARALVTAFERAAGLILPRFVWAYIHVRAHVR
ncbi:MAG TPA: class I SAM-dependent methyltransferase, partial [Polyangiaceae bacterium]